MLHQPIITCICSFTIEFVRCLLLFLFPHCNSSLVVYSHNIYSSRAEALNVIQDFIVDYFTRADYRDARRVWDYREGADSATSFFQRNALLFSRNSHLLHNSVRQHHRLPNR